MIVGMGTDVIGVARVRQLLERHREHFLDRYFSDGERAYCLRARDPSERLAARWAAKEAAMKALGTGWAEGVGFQQIAVERQDSGAPRLVLTGAAADRAAALGSSTSWVSLSHADGIAVATVILEACS